MDHTEEYGINDHRQPEPAPVSAQDTLINEAAADHFFRRRLHEDSDKEDNERYQFKLVKIHPDIAVHPCHQYSRAVHTDADQVTDQQVDGIVALTAGSVRLKQRAVFLNERV